MRKLAIGKASRSEQRPRVDDDRRPRGRNLHPHRRSVSFQGLFQSLVRGGAAESTSGECDFNGIDQVACEKMGRGDRG